MTSDLSNITLLTGIPRSGTTLLCSLLNQQANVVVSAEPAGVLLQTDASLAEQLRWCLKQIKKWRNQVQTEGTVLTRHVNGAIPENWLSKQEQITDTRRNLSALDNITVDKKINDRFHFVVKNPGAFTALLPALVETPINLFAVIRSPLALLVAWNATRFPVYHGRLPPGERLDAKLKHDLLATGDRIARQLILLSWFFDRYHRYLNKSQIIAYEQLIAAPATIVESILAQPPDSPLQTLQSRNIHADYPGINVDYLTDRLLNSEGAYWKFYRRDHVCGILS